MCMECHTHMRNCFFSSSCRFWDLNDHELLSGECFSVTDSLDDHQNFSPRKCTISNRFITGQTKEEEGWSSSDTYKWETSQLFYCVDRLTYTCLFFNECPKFGFVIRSTEILWDVLLKRSRYILLKHAQWHVNFYARAEFSSRGLPIYIISAIELFLSLILTLLIWFTK